MTCERRGLAYSGYTDLAQQPAVYALIRECVEEANAELAGEGHRIDLHQPLFEQGRGEGVVSLRRGHARL